MKDGVLDWSHKCDGIKSRCMIRLKPRMAEHMQLYLRLSLDDVKDLNDMLLSKMSMTGHMRLRAHEKLSLLGTLNQNGELTSWEKSQQNWGVNQKMPYCCGTSINLKSQRML